MIELVALVVVMCLLALIIGPLPRPVRDPHQEAERGWRIASIGFTISAVGFTVSGLCFLIWLVFR